MLKFASISPHPPILLPSVGSERDRIQVKKTIKSLESLGEKLKKSKIDSIIISSPHPDWGIKVPLHFLNSKFKKESVGLRPPCNCFAIKQKSKLQFKIQNYQNPNNVIIEPLNDFLVYPILTNIDSPKQHYEWGKEFYLKIKNLKLKIAVIASGDLSHCLKKEGPYEFHPDGPKFDKELIESLKKKDIDNILKLDDKYPEAGECGLRSFCFLLGILEASGLNYHPEILSYESPFGVGYLVVNFKLK